MTDASVPLGIGDEIYHLRFERADGRYLERTNPGRPILVLLDPRSFGWDIAAIFLHKGLKKINEKGEFVYLLPQDARGEAEAYDIAVRFTGLWEGPAAGLGILHGSISAAFAVSGFWKNPAEKAAEPKEGEIVKAVDPSKN